MSERDEFEAWFQCEQGKPYYSMYDFAKAAWSSSRATPQQAVPALTDEQIGRLRASLLSQIEPELADKAIAILAASQPSPEPKGPEHAHDWRFSLQDHVYKCDCGATCGDFPFGPATFKD